MTMPAMKGQRNKAALAGLTLALASSSSFKLFRFDAAKTSVNAPSAFEKRRATTMIRHVNDDRVLPLVL
ncbi:unnamed protein product [Sphagnum tenellum]